MKTLTYSAMSAFRDCRMMYKLRYIDCWTKIQRTTVLWTGSLVHDWLEQWHSGNAAELPEGQAGAICAGYAAKYGEPEILDFVEWQFKPLPIIDEYGKALRGWKFAGKIDGGKGRSLYEHKTASNPGADYWERLWTDTQIMLYADAARRHGLQIDSVVYNVLGKNQLKQKKDETEQEFIERQTQWQCDNPDAYHREIIVLSDNEVLQARKELYMIAKEINHCTATGHWYRNLNRCHQIGRRCQYYEYCRSGYNPMILENFYEQKEPHSELKEEQ